MGGCSPYREPGFWSLGEEQRAIMRTGETNHAASKCAVRLFDEPARPLDFSTIRHNADELNADRVAERVGSADNDSMLDRVEP